MKSTWNLHELNLKQHFNILVSQTYTTDSRITTEENSQGFA